MSSSPPTITVTGAQSPQVPQQHVSAAPSPAPPAMTPSAEVAATPTSDIQATSTPSAADLGPGSASAPLMPRSCVICRSRKVRCSRENPCANCRRAGIPCIFPSNDRPPRWARRLDRTGFPAAVAAAAGVRLEGGNGTAAAPAAVQVMERVHNLENLVRELRSQLDQAHAATAAATAAAGFTHPHAGTSTTGTSPGSTANTDGSSVSANTSQIQEQFGRLLVSDDNHSLYVSSGFWSRVNDELDGLKMETQGLAQEEAETSGEEGSPGNTPASPDYERTPADRHAFVFRHNLNPTSPDSSAFQPLPFEVSYLVDVFAENINALAQIVHMPTARKLVRNMRAGSHAALTPANEALMFSIYYAAITAMEEEDIGTNFKAGKAELALKYRLGFEHALAKADFLHVSDLVLVQALCNFLLVGRRHDSPSFIWMMTGIAIRMGQALGLHRDPDNFDNLTPYEAEVRRRVWWVLCILDVRSSEDQRAEVTIGIGSFDTKMPMNLNDSDIDPESTIRPVDREGITDITFARISFELCEITRRIIALGQKDGPPSLEDQTKLLDEMHESLQRTYLQHSSDPGNINIWGWICVVRITVAKMTLITHLPVLFSPASENHSEDIRNKLLVKAIELAEHNHALSSEPKCRQWRWIIQTYTHWHAIVFLLIEMARRPWSPIVERAWEVLRSPWLIPNQQFNIDKNLRVWMPLRKLMTTVRRHRETELARLRADPWAAGEVEAADGNIPIPRTAIDGAAAETVIKFREKWRRLVHLHDKPTNEMQGGGTYQAQGNQPWTMEQPAIFHAGQQAGNGAIGQQSVPNMASPYPAGQVVADPLGQAFGAPFDMAGNFDLNQQVNNTLAAGIPVSPAMSDLGDGVLGWLWSGTDPASDMFNSVNMDTLDMNMDLNGEMDWSRWVESAQGMEMDLESHVPV